MGGDNSDLLKLFPVDLATTSDTVPSHLESGVLHVLCGKKKDIFLQQKLELISGVPVKLILASEDYFLQRLREYQKFQDQLKGVSDEFRLEIVVDDGDVEKLQVLDSESEADGSIVKLINTLVLSALKKNVSDIHIESNENSVAVKYRIDGVLYPATVDLDKAYHSALVSRLKVMSELDIAERRVPQDGRFKLRVGHRYIDFRISIIPGLYGENVVVRVLDNQVIRQQESAMSLDLMGFSEEQIYVFKAAIREPHGMVLVTGPTGSGKTTTLYSALCSINSGEQKIITIEDPVEYQLQGVMQIPVNTKKGLGFAEGLRSILRHDPDKILVGEIRDSETAEIAVQSALTGHLVFSTLHANSAFDVLTRLKNMGVNLHNCLAALNCVVSQRLIRVNCVYCVKPHNITEAVLKDSNIDERLVGHVRKGAGCEHCSFTGYSGRKMICEVLKISQNLRERLAADGVLADLIRHAELVGGLDLRGAAIQLLKSGLTSVEEVNRVTFHR